MLAHRKFLCHLRWILLCAHIEECFEVRKKVQIEAIVAGLFCQDIRVQLSFLTVSNDRMKFDKDTQSFRLNMIREIVIGNLLQDTDCLFGTPDIEKQFCQFYFLQNMSFAQWTDHLYRIMHSRFYLLLERA